MRILHINKAYFPHVGGVETVCKQYVEVSKSCFDDVRVLTLSDQWGLGWHEECVENVKVRRCRWLFKISGQKFSLKLILQLILNAKKFIVKHAQTISLATWHSFLLKPIV